MEIQTAIVAKQCMLLLRSKHDIELDGLDRLHERYWHDIVDMQAALVECQLEDAVLTRIIDKLCRYLLHVGICDPHHALLILRTAVTVLQDEASVPSLLPKLRLVVHCHWESSFAGCADLCASIYEMLVDKIDDDIVDAHYLEYALLMPWHIKGRMRLMTALLRRCRPRVVSCRELRTRDGFSLQIAVSLERICEDLLCCCKFQYTGASSATLAGQLIQR